MTQNAEEGTNFFRTGKRKVHILSADNYDKTSYFKDIIAVKVG